jgi:hypothetical protein
MVMMQRLLVTLFAAGMASSAVLVEPGIAAGKDRDRDKSTAPTGPGAIEKPIQLAPKGLRWGLTLEGVARLYDKVLEAEMEPLFKKVERTPQDLPALEEELKNKQGILRRSRVEFGVTPTGIDQSALKGEYSYTNGESMAHMKLRSGTERHFFFFNDKLWKIYDEHRLQKGGNLGESFDEAVKILSKRFGATPKKVAANFEKGHPFDEMEWRDSEQVIRALDRGEVLGMVYADRTVQDNIAQYRRNKPVDQHEMDKDVALATAHPPTNPGKPEDKATKDKAAKDKAAKDKGGK